ncbi:putative RecB family exonuclease [Austwickia chelonae]|nr:PD-(D/E)XK nuclease family protein [Austwickia chelonae]SEW03762.1 putative RecB family exonuclease [Austwickia chelonae]
MPVALSPSRASDFMQCPLLYRFRTIDRLPEAPSAAAARGTLVHAVLERLFDLPAPRRTVEEACALLPGEWSRLVAERPDLAVLVSSEGEEPSEEGVSEQVWFDAARVLVERWFTLEDPVRLEPAERELYVEADLDGITLRGYVDRLDVAPDGRMRVVDYKTGRSPSPLFEGKALFQMKFYALVLWRMYDRLPTLLQLVYLGNGEMVRYEPREEDLRAVERKIKALSVAIDRAAETGEFRPSPGRLCDWCDHRALCPAWGGTPPPMPAR